MRPGLVSLAIAALAAAAPALAEPVVVAGAAPPRPAAMPSDCVVEPTGAASARIRCRVGGSVEHAGSELTFVVAAQSPAPAPCLAAEVVRLPGAPSAERARTLVVEAAPTPPCKA